MKARTLVFATSFCSSAAASVEVYKCVEAGKVVYSDAPRPEGTGKAISVRPAK